jgi:uncharacterized protein DUF5320
VARVANRPNPREGAAGAAVAEPARVKAGAAVVDRDKAAVQAEDAARTVEPILTPNKEDRTMPGFDRSGPMGAGPMTGGRRGLCGRPGGAYDRPAYGGGYGYGRGMAFRRGFGGGRGYGFGPAYGGYPYPQAYGTGYPVSSANEMEMLRADAEAMRQSLDAIQQRISELEKDGSE